MSPFAPPSDVEKLQVASALGIQRHIFRYRVGFECAHLAQNPGLGCGQVSENRARAADGQRQFLAAVGFQGQHAEVAQKRLPRPGSVKLLAGQRNGDFHVQFREVLAFRNQQFGGGKTVYLGG